MKIALESDQYYRFYADGGSYRYTFNGKETDAESDLQDYGMRMYNARLGKFISVDPIARKYAWYTPYQFAGNKPTIAIDFDGLEELPTTPNLLIKSGASIATVDYQGTAVTAVTFSSTYIGYYTGDGCDENSDPETYGCHPMTPSSTESVQVYTLDVTVYIDGNGNVVGGQYISQSADYSAEDNSGQRTMSNYQSKTGNELTSWGPNSLGFAGETENSPEVGFDLSDLAGNILLNTMTFNSVNDIDAPKQIEQEAIAPILNPTENAASSVIGACSTGGLGATISAVSTGIALCDYATTEQYSGVAREGIVLIEGSKHTYDQGTPYKLVETPIGYQKTDTPTADQLLAEPPK